MVKLDEFEANFSRLLGAMRFRKLTSRHYQHLARILADVALISLASVAIRFFLDDYRPGLAWLGVGVAFFFWILSFLAINKVKQYEF